MADQELSARVPRRLRLARAVSELLSPPQLLLVLVLAVAWQSSPNPGMAAVWGGTAALFAGVLPIALLVRGVRQGRLSDRHISLREQRIRFGILVIASTLAGLAALASLDAPARMIAVLASTAVGEVVGWVVTLWWKISAHAAIAAGAATVLLLVFGAPMLAAWPVVALVAWSRIQVGDHTPAQVLAGVALGVAVNAAVFPLLQ